MVPSGFDAASSGAQNLNRRTSGSLGSIIEQMKALPVKKLPAESSYVLEVPTTHQGQWSPHISSCGKLLDHDEKITCVVQTF
jgi:hypothetical protein